VIREQRMRVEHRAVIALGANLGDRESTIRDAVRDLARIPGVVVVAASGLVETPALKPEGIDPDAPAYLHAVVAVRTALPARELLEALQSIEREHGRVRDIRWGDRTLDLDIIAFGGLVIDEPELTVPHPRAFERAFVLAPWLQIEPDAAIPGHGRVDALLTATHETPTPYAAEPLT